MEKIYNNIINLCMNYQIEEPKNWLEFWLLELKFCKKKLNYLEKHKPSYFRKQKLKKYYKEKDELEKRLQIIKEKIKIELEILTKTFED